MTEAIRAIYENGVLRPLTPLNLSDRQTVWLTVSPEPFPQAIASLLQPLYNSGLLTPTVASHLPPLSDADLEVMVRSIQITGEPLSETMIEDRGEW
jgi:predicted DNA-binding antitoxin AbrB/MazE fold protein